MPRTSPASPASSLLERIRTHRGRRTAVVYAGLVLVPATLAVVLLSTAAPDRAAARPDAAAASTLPRLLLAIVAACKPAGLLAGRVGQAPVIGEMAAGVVLGPSVLGALWPNGLRRLVPPGVLSQLDVLAQLGVVLFVFLAGLEVNTRLLRGKGHVAVVVSHVGIALPFLLGVVLALRAHERLAPEQSGFLPFALFLGVAMSVTALPVMARILLETGLYRTELGTLALTCAVVDDVTAWTLLALVVALVTGGSAAAVLVTAALTVGFTAVLFLVVRPLLIRAESTLAVRHPDHAVALALVGLLGCAALTERIGVHAVFGAFMFGLVVPADSRWVAALRGRLGGLTMILLVPLFFAVSGLRTEIGLLGADPVAWLWCGLVLVAGVLGKFAGSAAAARAVGTGWRRSGQIGALMNCRGMTELIVLNVGLNLGVLSPTLFTMLVIMAFVSTALTTPVVSRLRGPDDADDGTPGPGALGAAEPEAAQEVSAKESS
ncbi:cation:proton antiporter [Streptomyces sp. NPDC059010]|uniref:cation:proton antiporter domain-containing protein n=1 Tax=Streptomyces sp. NPDC059010 TaxID=3346695 RepID=UPI003689B088